MLHLRMHCCIPILFFPQTILFILKISLRIPLYCTTISLLLCFPFRLVVFSFVIMLLICHFVGILIHGSTYFIVYVFHREQKFMVLYFIFYEEPNNNYYNNHVLIIKLLQVLVVLQILKIQIQHLNV